MAEWGAVVGWGNDGGWFAFEKDFSATLWFEDGQK